MNPFEKSGKVALIIDTLGNPGEFAVHYLAMQSKSVLIASPKPKEWWISAERKMGSNISNAVFVDIASVLSQELELKADSLVVIDVSCLLYLGNAPRDIVAFVSRLVDAIVVVLMVNQEEWAFGAAGSQFGE